MTECMYLRMTSLLYFIPDQNQVLLCQLLDKPYELFLDPPAHPLMQSAVAKGTWLVLIKRKTKLFYVLAAVLSVFILVLILLYQ